MGKRPTKAQGCSAPLQTTATWTRTFRQTGIAYGDGRPDAEQDTIPTRVRVYSLDGEPLRETTVYLTPRKQDDTIAVRVDRPSSSLAILERDVHVPERGCL
jgi:hypothetical protein